MTAGAVEARERVAGRPVVHIRLKVVPGASRAGLAGPYGDRLKVRVTAPAESGKANKAVLALLAAVLGVPATSLTLVRGPAHALKTIAVEGMEVDAVVAALESGGA